MKRSERGRMVLLLYATALGSTMFAIECPFIASSLYRRAWVRPTHPAGSPCAPDAPAGDGPRPHLPDDLFGHLSSLRVDGVDDAWRAAAGDHQFVAHHRAP